VRALIEADGARHVFSYNPVLGFVLSLGVGYVSSLLGIALGFVGVRIVLIAL